MKHELKTIKNTYKKTEAGVDRVMEMGEDVTDLRLLVSQLSSSIDGTNDLMARTVAITSEIKNRMENARVGEETITKFAKSWRMLLFSAGLFSTELALVGHYFGEGFSNCKYKWHACSYIFDVFSMTCLSAAAGSNPERIVWSLREKFFVTLCGVIMGLGYLLRGDWYKGAFASLVTALLFQGLARLYSTIPERQLNDALVRVFKLLPFILLIILYIGVTSLKCVLNAKEPGEECTDTSIEKDCKTVWQQCENPLLPAKLVCWFFWVTFALAQILPLVLKKEQMASWQNIISMQNLSRTDITCAILYSNQTLLALACQALTNLEEVGNEMGTVLNIVTISFQIHLVLFLLVVMTLAFFGKYHAQKRRAISGDNDDRYGPDSFLRNDTSGVARGDDAL